MASEPDRRVLTQAPDWGAALALLPITATLNYYFLPNSLQKQLAVQLAPQLLAYLALSLWSAHTTNIVSRLGLEKRNMRDGLRWGFLTGLLLGCLNTFVILSVYPYLDYDISFLKTTPHAQLPVIVMVPWFICGIALFVELNFRGYLLGRLAELESCVWGPGLAQRLSPLALITSAVIFAFDPFMVHTFHHLHWIAVWDGLIWGTLWLRTRNLYITIVAHTVEVVILYSAVRTALG